MTQNQNDHNRLNAILEDAGVSKTIYSLVMPETRSIIDTVIDGGDRQNILEKGLTEYFSHHAKGAPDVSALAHYLDEYLAAHRQTHYHDLYEEAWTQKQDKMHETFFETWKDWTSSVIKADWDQFPYMYPTSGASEALREAIHSYADAARQNGKKPVIHAFEGEYEGFTAYAQTAGIEIRTHNRKNWREEIKTIGPGEQFYLSHPSAIDGNIWPDYDEFAQKLCDTQPSAELMLDVTYVGCVAKPFEFKADYPNIPTIFFSLSKPAGAYYHRIGGCLSRGALKNTPQIPELGQDQPELRELTERYSGLFGNKWFKSLMALRIGTELMQRHDVHELPEQYQEIQAKAIEQANANLGYNLAPSDVFLLATMEPTDTADGLQNYLTRGSKGQELVRVCLTPTMAHLINPNINPHVKARPHEGIKSRRDP